MNRNQRIVSKLRDSRAKWCEAGFTIVELLIVIAVIAILASITVIGYNVIVTRAAEASLHSDLQSAAARLKQYHQEKRTYPASIDDLSGGLAHSDDNTLTYIGNDVDFCVAASSNREGLSTFYITSSGTVQEGTCPALQEAEEPVAADPNDEAPSSVTNVCLAGASTPSGYTLYDATGMSTVTLKTSKDYIVKNTASVTAVENSGAGDLIFCGQDNTLAVAFDGGGSGDKLILTGSGNDTFTVSSSNATIISGAGADTIDATGPSAVVYAGAGNDTVSFSGASTKIYGGSGNDTISGSGANAIVWGGLGTDTINATGGGSTVYQD